MSRYKFLLEALKNFREVGTVTRSGPSLRNKIASYLTNEDIHVLELGAGDGAITKALLQKLPANGKLLAFEINPNMFQAMVDSIDDDRLIAINDSAENVEAYMKLHDIESFDVIVSAIPYIVLPESLAKKILNLCKNNLKKGKPYLQVHYAKTLMSLYRGVFGNIKAHRVWINVPPAFVFECIR